MNYILFDDSTRKNLLPLTFTRPICELRVGILTIREKWEKYLDAKVSFLTENYLLEKYSLIKKNDNILINGSVIPTKEMVKQISILKRKEAIVTDDYIIAIRLDEEDLKDMHDSGSEKMKGTDSPDSNGLIYKKYNKNHTRISFPWQIFKNNQQEIENDFTLITEGRKSQPISKTNTVFNAENIFIEEGARVECAILNAENGPIYVGENAEIMEGAIIRGALALCNNSTIKMGAKIYGATTFGPHVKIGGEVNNSVFLGYANKAHDGFVGNSVIGEWCNLGADTNTSNLKNTYEEVRLWSYVDKSFSNTGEQFVGLIMGDHSKCGINTMFNTGSVVGVNSNVFGDGYQRNFIPSFMWGGKSGYSKYSYAKAVKVAKVVYNRRNMEFNKIEQNIFKTIFNKTLNIKA